MRSAEKESRRHQVKDRARERGAECRECRNKHTASRERERDKEKEKRNEARKETERKRITHDPHAWSHGSAQLLEVKNRTVIIATNENLTLLVDC